MSADSKAGEVPAKTGGRRPVGLPPAPAEAAPAPPRQPQPRPAPESLANVSLSSVEVSRNAKGDTTFSVKVYDPDAEAAREEAVRIYESLTVTYTGKPPAPQE